MITAIALATLALGYIAGRIHGHAAHKRFLAEGFRYLDQVTSGQRTLTGVGRVTSEVEVVRAFGSLRHQGAEQ